MLNSLNVRDLKYIPYAPSCLKSLLSYLLCALLPTGWALYYKWDPQTSLTKPWSYDTHIVYHLSWQSPVHVLLKTLHQQKFSSLHILGIANNFQVSVRNARHEIQRWSMFLVQVQFRSNAHPKFNSIGLQTFDFQIMDKTSDICSHENWEMGL